MAPTISVVRKWSAPHPTSLRLTLGMLHRGRSDATSAFLPSGFWRATRTPEGPATQRIRSSDGNGFEVAAWGPGARWIADRAPVLLGANEEHAAFPDHHGEIVHLHREYAAMRTPCTQAIFETLFPVVLEQKVTGREARSSYARLLRHFGEFAPDPGGNGPRLLLPPDPGTVGSAPSHVFHAANVEQKRSSTIKRAAGWALRLEDTALDPDSARRSLALLPGIGTWSVAEISKIAFGDTDAVPVGDFHVKNWVSWNLAGEPRGTDEDMLALLEPFRPFRGRVIRLLQLGGNAPPRYGPRLTIQQRW